LGVRHGDFPDAVEAAASYRGRVISEEANEMRRGGAPTTRWAAIGTAVVLAGAGCGGGVGGGGVPAPTSAAVVTTPTGSTAPAVDPAVVHWANAWKRRIERPMRRAVTTLAANIDPAIAGSSSAAFRLTPALTALSNCRNPLDAGLAQTPPELVKERRRTLAACRAIYVATDRVVAGMNTQSAATADAGVTALRDGLDRLRRIGRELKRAAGAQ
jgi:hypothetical protein